MAYLGEIRMFSSNDITKVPYGWAYADGSSLSIGLFPDLFNLIKHAYDTPPQSTTRFQLPDLRSRVPIGWPAGGLTGPAMAAGLTRTYQIAQNGGEETHVLSAGEMANHTHTVTDLGHTHTITEPNAGLGHTHPITGDVNNGAGTEYVNTAGNKGAISTATGPAFTGITLGSSVTGVTIANAGSGLSHNNMQPFLVLMYIIRVLP